MFCTFLHRLVASLAPDSPATGKGYIQWRQKELTDHVLHRRVRGSSILKRLYIRFREEAGDVNEVGEWSVGSST